MYLQQVFLLRCPCGKPIVLPRQSPLGKYEDQQYLPTDEWPLTFACIHCGQSSVHLPHTHQMEEAATLAQYLRLESLWRFEFECVHESCGQRHTIYTIGKRDTDALDLLNAILHIVPPPHWHVDKGYGMPSFPSQKIQEKRFDYDF